MNSSLAAAIKDLLLFVFFFYTTVTRLFVFCNINIYDLKAKHLVIFSLVPIHWQCSSLCKNHSVFCRFRHYVKRLSAWGHDEQDIFFLCSTVMRHYFPILCYNDFYDLTTENCKKLKLSHSSFTAFLQFPCCTCTSGDNVKYKCRKRYASI